jgi:hypothetical protein
MELSNVTLVALSSINIYETIKAMKYSMKKIKFGDCVFISHRKPFYLPKNIRYEYTSKLKTIDDYNYKMLFEVHNYIKTDFILIVHYDGFIINPEMWRDEFFNYDYIGSPWPYNMIKDKFGNIIRVGNGVSLRSKKLLELPQKIKIPFNYGDGHINSEDTFICARYRHLFMENGINFAPIDTAKYFGHEMWIPEIEGIKPFLFHKWEGNNRHYKKFLGPKKIIKAFVPYGILIIRQSIMEWKTKNNIKKNGT